MSYALENSRSKKDGQLVGGFNPKQGLLDKDNVSKMNLRGRKGSSGHDYLFYKEGLHTQHECFRIYLVDGSLDSDGSPIVNILNVLVFLNQC